MDCLMKANRGCFVKWSGHIASSRLPPFCYNTFYILVGIQVPFGIVYLIGRGSFRDFEGDDLLADCLALKGGTAINLLLSKLQQVY